MAQEQEGLYLGLDLTNRYAMISLYELHMSEPQTISTVMGSENYQIPMHLAKKKGLGQWFFGREAQMRVNAGDAVGVEDLLGKAMRGEEVYVDHERYYAVDLFTIFLKRVLALTGGAYMTHPLARLVICTEHINVDAMSFYSSVVTKLSLDSSKLLLIDRRESFYYYALSQKPETFLHDVILFDYTTSDLSSCLLQRNIRSTPQVITLAEESHGKLLEKKDEEFEAVCKKAMEGHVISGVYLIGDGFDGDWMKTSLQYLCRMRKVFLGKNLYSKGACYAGAMRDGVRDWPFIYIGDNELKMNLYLKVLIKSEMQFYTLNTAGDSWLESRGECEVILDGTPEIEVWIQRPESREAHVEVLELTDLVPRERRMTRLRITSEPESDRRIKISIRDLGFGELAPSSNQTWEHTVCLEE